MPPVWQGLSRTTPGCSRGDTPEPVPGSAEAAETGGLRIAQEQSGPGLGVTVATAPEADDQVIEAAGVRVFLDRSAATALDDKVLDASASADGRVDLAVGQQV